MGRIRPILLSLLLLPLSLSLTSQADVPRAPTAARVNETWVHSGWLTSQDVARWSKSPGTRNYVIRFSRPDAQELKSLSELSNADSLTIETESYPESVDIGLWAKLARKFSPLKLRLLDLQLPGDDEIANLNAINAASLDFVITYFPDTNESERLITIQSPLSIEFRTPFYPRYEEKELLLAVPASVSFTFVSSIWPWYHQMDLFNMIPHAKNLRINDGSYPSDAHWDYFNNIHDLRETTVVSDFPPPTEDTWERFNNGAVTWVFRAGIPEDAHLKAFERSSDITGSRRLVIETESPLSKEDRSRLNGIKIPVELKQPAPID